MGISYVTAADRFPGLYRGVVANIRDPQDLGRIKVRVPQVLGATLSAWAEPMAAVDEVPAVGERVWINFEGGDPRYPVWNSPSSTVGELITAEVIFYTDADFTVNVDIDGKNYDIPRVQSYIPDNGDTAIIGRTPAGFIALGKNADSLDLWVRGQLVVDGDTSINGHLDANGADINGQLNANANLYVQGTATVNTNLIVNNTGYFGQYVQMNNGLGVTGGLTETNALSVYGNANFTSSMLTQFVGVQGGMEVAGGGITLDNGNWIKRGNLAGLSMRNGWGYFGGGYQDPSYAEFPDRTAGLFGVASTGATGGGTVIGVLPGFVSPNQDHVFSATADGGKTIQIVVRSSGDVVIQNASTAPTSWVALGSPRWTMNGF